MRRCSLLFSLVVPFMVLFDLGPLIFLDIEALLFILGKIMLSLSLPYLILANVAFLFVKSMLLSEDNA